MAAPPRPPSVAPRCKRALAGALAAVCLALAALSPATTQAETLSFTLPEARAVANEAWARGDLPLANALSRELTRAAPQDVAALLIFSATETALGRPASGRSAGRRAFAQAETRTQRYDAAYLVSAGAMAQERYAAAQYWLRRAWHVADSEEERARIERAFRGVRAASPWTLRLSFDIAPTDNINGGAQSPFLIIDDTPYVGLLSGAARALPGVRTSVSGSLGYDIVRRADARTRLTFQAYRSVNTLSDEARTIAPDVDGSDFDYAVAELQLSHRIAEPAGPLPDTYRLAFGQTWYGGERLDRVARLTFGRSVPLGPDTLVRLTAEGEQRLSDRDSADRHGTEVGATLLHELPGGLLLRFGVDAVRVGSADANLDYSSWGAEAGLSMGDPLWGMRLSGVIDYSARDYDSYSVGFIDVPGGRQDEVWEARLDLSVDAADLWGFVPVLSLTGRSATSNISRFEGDSFGLSVGFASAF